MYPGRSRRVSPQPSSKHEQSRIARRSLIAPHSLSSVSPLDSQRSSGGREGKAVRGPDWCPTSRIKRDNTTGTRNMRVSCLVVVFCVPPNREIKVARDADVTAVT